MARVTTKLQLTIPKGLADAYGIRPGDEVDLLASGPVIRLVPPRARRRQITNEERTAIVQEMIDRIRDRARAEPMQPGRDRGWRREDAYEDRMSRWRR